MYKWKPNASQRKEFAQRMKDPEEQAIYLERKHAKNSYNPNDSRSFANRCFIPTQFQYEVAVNMLGKDLTDEQKHAAKIVMSGYSCQDKVHHNYIHIINHFNDVI